MHDGRVLATGTPAVSRELAGSQRWKTLSSPIWRRRAGCKRAVGWAQSVPPKPAAAVASGRGRERSRVVLGLRRLLPTPSRETLELLRDPIRLSSRCSAPLS